MLCLLYPLRPESRTKFIAHTVLLPKEYSTLRAYTHQHSSRKNFNFVWASLQRRFSSARIVVWRGGLAGCVAQALRRRRLVQEHRSPAIGPRQAAPPAAAR